MANKTRINKLQIIEVLYAWAIGVPSSANVKSPLFEQVLYSEVVDRR
jgi:hypothetical protein